MTGIPLEVHGAAATVLAANEAVAKLPKDQRPAPLPEDLRFYGLRHTCAGLLIAQGTSVKAVQTQFGHATASITPLSRSRDGPMANQPTTA